jgi:hypothetical protein
MEIDYGKLTKRVVFTENDHRHAKFLIKLKQDGLTQAAFFRQILSGYVEGDERIQSFVDQHKPQSKKHKKKVRQRREAGHEAILDHGFSEEQIEDLYDLIAEEHPEL